MFIKLISNILILIFLFSCFNDSKVKEFPTIDNNNLNITFSLTTKKLSARKAAYIFLALPKSDEIKTWLDDKLISYANPFFNLKILDDDGFVLFKINIELKKTTRIVDEQDNTISYEYQGEIDLKNLEYKSFTSWSVGWSGFGDVPKKKPLTQQEVNATFDEIFGKTQEQLDADKREEERNATFDEVFGKTLEQLDREKRENENNTTQE